MKRQDVIVVLAATLWLGVSLSTVGKPFMALFIPPKWADDIISSALFSAWWGFSVSCLLHLPVQVRHESPDGFMILVGLSCTLLIAYMALCLPCVRNTDLLALVTLSYRIVSLLSLSVVIAAFGLLNWTCRFQNQALSPAIKALRRSSHVTILVTYVYSLYLSELAVRMIGRWLEDPML